MSLVPRTGAELRALRKASAERFTAIAMMYVPPGYTVKYWRRLAGLHRPDGLIVAPRPVTRRSLYFFLHEYAHAQLRHGYPGDSRPAYMQEMEAEIYAHGVMRYHGIPVPRVMTKEARANVWVKIFWARRSGITWIDPEARRYARYNKSSQALVQRYRAMDEAKKKPPRRAA